MVRQRLKLSRAQLGAFLTDHESIKQFEKLFDVVDSVSETNIESDPYVSLDIRTEESSKNVLNHNDLWDPTSESHISHDHTLTGTGTHSNPLKVPPYLYFGCITQPSYVDNLNGTVTIGPAGVYSLSDVVSGDVIPLQFTIAGGIFTPVDGALSYLVADYNAGAPILRITSTVTEINETTIIPVRTFFRTGNEVHQIDWDTLGVALPNKIHQSIVKTERFRRQDGLALSEVATRRITLTAGTIWVGATPILNAAFNQTTDSCDLYYHVAGVWTKTTITQYNNTQYDNGTALTALTGASKYAVNFVYRLVNSAEKHCIVVLGTGNFLLPEAQQSQPPPNLPPEITSMCVLVGRIIVANGAAVATQIDSAFVSTFTPSATTNHNDLALLQGGTAGEYYHLTSAEYTGTGTGVFVRADQPIFTDFITLPKTSGMGIKVDEAAPTYPWADITGIMLEDPGGANSPVLTTFRGGLVRLFAYTTSDKVDMRLHIPHDYAPGTDMYVHVHWSHNGTAINGNFTLSCASTYAKGHNQAPFPAEKAVTITYATVNIATTPQYQHRIDEVQWSSNGGSATLFDSAQLEPDGLILMNCTLTSLPTITGGTSPKVFISYIDLHYQSTGIFTKQKAPNFYV